MNVEFWAPSKFNERMSAPRKRFGEESKRLFDLFVEQIANGLKKKEFGIFPFNLSLDQKFENKKDVLKIRVLSKLIDRFYSRVSFTFPNGHWMLTRKPQSSQEMLNKKQVVKM